MIETRSRLPAMSMISGKRMKVGLTVVSLLTDLWLVASLAFAYRLTRRMRPPFPEPLPAVNWGQFEPHRFRTTDGEDVPVLILAAEEDPVARPVEARAIFDRVQSHGRLVLFRYAGHLDFPETCPDLYRRVISQFVDGVKKQGAARSTVISDPQVPRCPPEYDSQDTSRHQHAL